MPPSLSLMFSSFWFKVRDIILFLSPKLLEAIMDVSHSVVSNSLQSPRLCYPWDSPGKNTGVGCHFLLQGIFPTEGLNLAHLRLLHWWAGSLPTEPPGSHYRIINWTNFNTVVSQGTGRPRVKAGRWSSQNTHIYQLSLLPYSSKEDIQMANRHTRRCSTPIITIEMQIKSTRYQLIAVRVAIIKKSTNNKSWRGCGEKGTLLRCRWECTLV